MAVKKLDPSRTTVLRRKFARDIAARMRELKVWINLWLVADDSLGLVPRVPFTLNVVREFEFATSADKLTAFSKAFQKQLNAKLLTIDNVGKPWSDQYVTSAYKKGVEHGYFAVRKVARTQSLDFYEGSKAEFLRSAFFAPEAVSKIQLVASRSFENLKGISSATSLQINRIMADGLINGQGPAAIAAAMHKQIDKITRTRALTLARTEIIFAHAEGQLDSFERLGIEEVGIQAEWSTAGDDRVCAQCADLEGQVMTIKEARGLIPLHPSCRCAWTPVIKQRRKAA